MLHHPVGRRVEKTDDGTPIAFRESTVVVVVDDGGIVTDDTVPSAFLADNDLVPTGVIRDCGVIVARPRYEESSLLAQVARLNLKVGGPIVGVCVDNYQGEDVVTTEFLPAPLKGAYARGDGGFGAMHRKQWHHFAARTLPAVQFLKRLPDRDWSGLIGVVEAAYGERPLRYEDISIDPARLKAPWKFNVRVRGTGAGPADYSVTGIEAVGDGDLESLRLNVPESRRKPLLSLPNVPNFPPYDDQGIPWFTTSDHGLLVISYLAGDGNKTHKYREDGGTETDNFVLGPAFDMNVRPVGMGGWTLTHVVAAFGKMAEDDQVKIINYSSSQWVIDHPRHSKEGVTINPKAQVAALRKAVENLCGKGGKVLVCSAGN
ncbi:MAG: S8 family peptidase, partial [Syntrophales bacterium]|nr:S8 family peptidase [Syntrophales bacterium]